MSTDTKWFYADGENSIGPFDETALTKMIGAGLIEGSTPIVREGGQSWGRLDESPLRKFLITDENQSDPIFRGPPTTNRAASSVPRQILVLLVDVYVALFRLAWENARRLATLLWRLRLKVPRPWRYVADCILALFVIVGVFARSSVDDPDVNKAGVASAFFPWSKHRSAPSTDSVSSPNWYNIGYNYGLTRRGQLWVGTDTDHLLWLNVMGYVHGNSIPYENLKAFDSGLREGLKLYGDDRRKPEYNDGGD